MHSCIRSFKRTYLNTYYVLSHTPAVGESGGRGGFGLGPPAAGDALSLAPAEQQNPLMGSTSLFVLLPPPPGSRRKTYPKMNRQAELEIRKCKKQGMRTNFYLKNPLGLASTTCKQSATHNDFVLFIAICNFCFFHMCKTKYEACRVYETNNADDISANSLPGQTPWPVVWCTRNRCYT